MADLKDWKSLANPDPEWEQWVQSIGGQAPDIGQFPDIPSLRQWISASKQAMTAQMGGNIPGVKETDHQIDTQDGSKITVRTYQPEKKPSDGSPMYVMLHGGGFCIGGLENEELLCRLLCSKYGVTAVNVDYRLAPEHKFPAAPNDCYGATKWAAKNAESLGADLKRGFLVGGTSAGGNLAAVVSMLWRDEKQQPPLTGQHLMIPTVCAEKAFPERYRGDLHSLEQNKDAAILSAKAMELFSSNYHPGEDTRTDTKSSPLLAGLHGLPKTYLQVCGLDPLRDEALIYERILREEEGIETKVDVYPGLPHGFWSIAPTLKASERFVEDSVAGVGWLLQQK